MAIVLRYPQSSRKPSRHARTVQARLAANGYDVPTSGVYDAPTASAVLDFQRAHVNRRRLPLLVDGIVLVGGDETWWALHHASGDDQIGLSIGEAGMLLGQIHRGQNRTLLERAIAEMGTRESPDGSNGGPRVDVYTDGWRAPWCAMFVSYVIREALMVKAAFPPHRTRAGVAKIERWASEAGRLSGVPTVGDVFLMLNRGGLGVDDDRGHCGFVLSVGGNRIATVEGNFGNGVGGTWRSIDGMRFARMVF